MSATAASTTAVDVEKRLKNLQKKLRQIEDLKQKADQLDSEAQKKVDSEEEVRAEIAALGGVAPVPGGRDSSEKKDGKGEVSILEQIEAAETLAVVVETEAPSNKRHGTGKPKITAGCYVMDKADAKRAKKKGNARGCVVGTVLEIDSDGDPEILFSDGTKRCQDKKDYVLISKEEFEEAVKPIPKAPCKHEMQVFAIKWEDSRSCSKCQESIPKGTKMSGCQKCSYNVCQSCASTSEWDAKSEYANPWDH